MAGVTQDTLNADEIQYLQNITLSPKIMKDGAVTKLDQHNSPVHNILMRKAQKSDQPAQGTFRCYVSGNRGQKITWWDGRDILPFDNKETTMKMEYKIGRGHMGAEFLHEVFAQAGVNIDYTKGIRKGGGAAKKKAVETAIKVLEDKIEDIRYNWTDEMRKTLWNDNVATPKAFTGISGLLPPTTSYSGNIGGLPRSNPILQHNVVTGITIDNIQLAFSQMWRRITRFASVNPADYVVACGDEAYDLMADLFLGTSTRAGKADYQIARDYAKEMGQKLNIGLPPDSFVTNGGALVTNDPTFEALQNEFAPAWNWQKSIWFLCTKHLRVVPVLEQTVDHPMPHNKRVQYSSYHGELALTLDHPRSCGVMLLA